MRFVIAIKARHSHARTRVQSSAIVSDVSLVPPLRDFSPNVLYQKIHCCFVHSIDDSIYPRTSYKGNCAVCSICMLL